MRKAILYIFFLGMLVNQSAHAFALASNPDAGNGKAAAKTEARSTTFYSDGSGSSAFSKSDLVYDNDNDNENEDSNVQIITLKKKDLGITAFNFISLPSDRNTTTALTDGRIYYYHNFSRLPRHNYISLRVLRL